MKKRIRSKNISDETIDLIVQLLDGWASKLTWDHLISAIDFRINQHYTRQALSNQTKIKQAYDKAKQRLQSNKQSNKMQVNQLDKLKQVELENYKLKDQNHELLAQCARWTYNAYLLGISIDELDRPIQEINPKNNI
jgi:hypothetical protein